jgi:sulfatase modifying factor 1
VAEVHRQYGDGILLGGALLRGYSRAFPGKNCPIQLVRIHEATAYCNWKSEREGLQPVYHISQGRLLRDPEADGYRIPTTEEWDYAARGGRLSRGCRYAGSDDADLVGWVNLSWEEGTKPVGGKLPNELGLYDMTGNIREWTWPDRGIPSNPDDSNEILHVRGGSWTTDREQSVLSFDRLVWVYQWNPIGFRLARNADSSDVD